jgi:hypothetical protein
MSSVYICVLANPPDIGVHKVPTPGERLNQAEVRGGLVGAIASTMMGGEHKQHGKNKSFLQ